MSTEGSGADHDALRALWAEAEQRLYPVAVSDPSRYERGVMLVRAIADAIGAAGVDDLDGLASLWVEREDLVTSAATESGIAVDLPREVLAGAAFSFRRAAILAEQARRRREALVRQARDEGDTWVRLVESGDLGAGVLAPFHALDLHLDTGLGLVQSVEMDPLDGGARHIVSVIRLDPVDGEIEDLEPGFVEPIESLDAETHRGIVADVRRRIEHVRPTAGSDKRRLLS